MKDECAGTPIAEAVCLRAKMYSIKKGKSEIIKKAEDIIKKEVKNKDEEEIIKKAKEEKKKEIISKAKGVKKNVVKNQIKHEQYKETLFGGGQMWHGMKMLRSEGHEIYGMRVNKVSLSAYDSKRWIAENGVDTYAYGYSY